MVEKLTFFTEISNAIAHVEFQVSSAESRRGQPSCHSLR
mgnify:CR=1 FL=1